MLGQDLDDLVGQVDRPLGFVLRWPDHDGDPGDGVDQFLPAVRSAAFARWSWRVTRSVRARKSM